MVTQVLYSQADAPAAPGISERVGQTGRSLIAQRNEFRNWLEIAAKSDQYQRYVTQLATLGAQMEFLYARLEEQIRDVSTADGERAAYSKLRMIDRRIIWARRLASYFQTRFDQRKDAAYATVLRAADDIAWSCYAQPFEKTGAPVPAAPLPFVASVYSPYAIPRDEPPQELRSEVDAEFFGQMLAQIPVPVTGLPELALEEPWWLAYLAHEIGHHVQFDFDGGSILKAFADTLDAAGGARWRGWGKELFADFYSLLMIGPWALWALAELVWGDTAAMLDESNPRYPSPLVRLCFMSEVATALRMNGKSALRGLDADALLAGGPVMLRNRDLCESARNDLRSVGAIAQTVVDAKFGDFGTLSELCAFTASDFAPNEWVANWSRALRGEGEMMPKRALRSARLVLGAGVSAWAVTREIAGKEQRDKQRVALRTRLLDSIDQNRDEKTRAAEAPAEQDFEACNERLAGLLFGDVP